jgi:hypothetical protein
VVLLTTPDHPKIAERLGHVVQVTRRALERQALFEQRCCPRLVALHDGHLAQVQQGDRHAVGVGRSPQQRQALLAKLACRGEIALVPRHRAQVVERSGNARRVAELPLDLQALAVPCPGQGAVSPPPPPFTVLSEMSAVDPGPATRKPSYWKSLTVTSLILACPIPAGPATSDGRAPMLIPWPALGSRQRLRGHVADVGDRARAGGLRDHGRSRKYASGSALVAAAPGSSFTRMCSEPGLR